jgi:site-specific DNA-methyltransferase (adenine-specific)
LKNLNKDGSSRESQILLGDNLSLLNKMDDESFQMIYIDPPFNTGDTQSMAKQSTIDGVKILGRTIEYSDTFANFWAFLEPRLREAWRLLADTGTLYLHLDYREVHYAKVVLDSIFGRENFLNEIIWAYDYGAKSKKKWPTKHDNILVYVKNREAYYYNSDEVDREPYMAPGLVTPEKAEKGKLPTDVWWHTIVPTNGKERTGYPTQKPEGILRRMIQASTVEGDWVLDFFAGSGTTGAVAKKLGRNYVMIDEKEDAKKIMDERLANVSSSS